MKQLTIAALLLLLLQACQKDKPNSAPPASATPSQYFFPMKTGNYWVYKVSSEQATYPNSNIVVSYDTISIVRDTVINSITYYEFKASNMQMIHNGALLGDSAGFIIYPNGGGRFHLSTAANDTLYADTTDAAMFYRVYRSGNLDTLISVPAGSYQTVEAVLDAYYLPPVPHPNLTNPRQVLHYFAKDIGLTKCITWYSSASGDIVSELQSYHLQP